MKIASTVGSIALGWFIPYASSYELYHSNPINNIRLQNLTSATATADDAPLYAECTAEHMRDVKGFMFDLDGTIYTPKGVLPGVKKFLQYADPDDNVPYTMLSNSFKSKRGVQAKFREKKYDVGLEVPERKIYTAAYALVEYFRKNVPEGARVFGLSSGTSYEDTPSDWIYDILRREIEPKLYKSWQLRTDLTMDEINGWAKAALDGDYVAVLQTCVPFMNDTIGGDPVTKKPGYTELSEELLNKTTRLLRNNAYYIVGALDAVGPDTGNPEYPGLDVAECGCGGLEQFFLASAEMIVGTKREEKYHINVGKGGNQGKEYMMDKGVELLRAMDSTIKNENVFMVGDNYSTDIMGGNLAGTKTMLILVGAHSVEDLVKWTDAHEPTCWLPDIGYIPDLMEAAKGLKNVAVSHIAATTIPVVASLLVAGLFM